MYDPSGESTRVRYRVLAAACTLAVLTYVQRQGFVAGTPRLQQDLHLDDEQLGYLLAGWLLAYGASQVPLGLVGDWLGARHLLTLLVLGWSLVLAAVALIALVPAGPWLPFALLFLLRCLFGMFQGGGFPGLARVIADWIPTQQRGSAQGLMWTFSRLGGFVAPLLVFWLFHVYSSWAIPFVILGSLGIFWCAGFWPWFRNRPEEMPQVNAAERALIDARFAETVQHGGPVSQPAAVPDGSVRAGDGAGLLRAGRPARGPIAEQAPVPAGQTGVSIARTRVPWSRLLTSRSAWALCLMYGFLGFSGNFFTNWLPSYLKGHRHLDDDTTAWLSALPLAFGIGSCVLGGAVSDWLIRRAGSRNWGRRLVAGTSMLLAGGCTLASIWIEEVWLLGLMFNLAFFFNDAPMGPAWASAADVGERHAGTLSGAMNMTGQLLAAIAMSAAGWLFQRHLDDWVFVGFACSYALGALCWLAVDVTKPLTPVDHIRGPLVLPPTDSK